MPLCPFYDIEIGAAKVMPKSRRRGKFKARNRSNTRGR